MLLLAPVARGAGEPAAKPRGEPATIDAARVSFAQGTRLAVAESNVVIRYQGAVLTADRVRFDTDTKDAWAEGNVRVNRDGREWTAPAFHYNFETRELEADEARGWLGPVIVHGEGLHKGGTNEYGLASASATTCDYLPPHYHFEARRAEVYPGEKLLLYNVTLRFGETPVLWFPMLAWTLKGDLQPVVIGFGSSGSLGFYTLLSSTWALNRHTDLTVHLDGYTSRGVGIGADLKYDWPLVGDGLLRGWYIHDGDPMDKADREAGKDLPTDRYRLQWQDRLALRDNLQITIDLNKQSDTDVVDDFRHDEFRAEREPATTFDVTLRGPNNTISLTARPQLNDFFAEVERLPELSWTLDRTRLGETPIFLEGQASLGYLANDPGDTGDPVFRGHALRGIAFEQLLVPMRWFGWLNVVPRAGLGGAYYSHAPDRPADDEDVQRALYNVGVETAFKLSRAWEGAQNRFFQVDGLRHIIQPFANYHWIPASDNGTNELFQFDTVRYEPLLNGNALSVTRWSPLELPADNAIDALDKAHVVRFGLRQALQTRREGRTWDIVDLTGWTDYRLEHEDGQHDFNDVFGLVRLRPYEWLQGEANARFDLYDSLVQEFNTAARIVKGDAWSLGVGTRYLRGDSSLISFGGAVRLTARLTAWSYQRVDINDGTWESQEYVLRQETHDWLITYGCRYRSERTKPNELTLYVGVTLKAFPNLGLTMNQVGIGLGD